MWLNSEFRKNEWCCTAEASETCCIHAASRCYFLRPLWGRIRNPNKFAALCPETFLNLFIIWDINRFCPLIIVKITATNSFQLWRNCCIDQRGGTFFWRLWVTKKNKAGRQKCRDNTVCQTLKIHFCMTQITCYCLRETCYTLLWFQKSFGLGRKGGKSVCKWIYKDQHLIDCTNNYILLCLKESFIVVNTI